MKLSDLVYFIHEDYASQTNNNLPPISSLASQYVNAVESLYTVFTGNSLVDNEDIVIHDGYARMTGMSDIPQTQDLFYDVQRPESINMDESDFYVIQSLISHAITILPNQGIAAREAYIGELVGASENVGRILTPFGKALTVSQVDDLSLALHLCEVLPDPRVLIVDLLAESSQHESAYQRRIIAGIINIVTLYGTDIYEDREE